MMKIITLFKRDFKNNAKITEEYAVQPQKEWMATEKLDGTNVRLTVRNHQLVRVEKRRKPNKIQKHNGIIEPWYVDASEYESSDKYIVEAAKNTDISNVEDGEWEGEALGPKIQGNPLNLSEHKVFLFSVSNVRASVAIGDAPTTFKELKEWLPKQRSAYGNDCPIEGIVWYKQGIPVAKIKAKDFN